MKNVPAPPCAGPSHDDCLCHILPAPPPGTLPDEMDLEKLLVDPILAPFLREAPESE